MCHKGIYRALQLKFNVHVYNNIPRKYITTLWEESLLINRQYIN